MSDGERIRRPEPERTQPLRGGWLGLFAPRPGRRGPEPGAGPERPGAGGQGAVDDAVSRAVDLGYRVVDDYIRQGQKTARLFNERAYGPEAMRNDFLEFSSRMWEYASGFAELWLEALGAASDAGARPGPAPPAQPEARTPNRQNGPAKAPSPPDAAPPLRVSVAVDSARPTAVTIDLRPEAAEGRLLVHDLRSVEPDKPRLTEITVTSGAEERPPSFKLRVPPDQPPGVYSGLVIDEASGLPVGALSVHVVE